MGGQGSPGLNLYIKRFPEVRKGENTRDLEKSKRTEFCDALVLPATRAEVRIKDRERITFFRGGRKKKKNKEKDKTEENRQRPEKICVGHSPGEN